MKQILITGATGMLGYQVVKALASETHITTRLMRHHVPPRSFSQTIAQRVREAYRRSYRTSHPVSFPARAQWVEADLVSGEGLREAVRDIDVIIHCAAGIGRLLEAAQAADVSHIVYISIVGCDRIPLSYYRQKVAEEEALKASGISWSILRATQFHTLIDGLLRACSWVPGLTLLPANWRSQPIAECEVGRRLADLALASPTGAIQEIGGPQVLSLREMARTWISLRQMRRAILPLWIAGKVAAGYRRGDNTCAECLRGQITWAQWVQETYRGVPDASSPALETGVKG